MMGILAPKPVLFDSYPLNCGREILVASPESNGCMAIHQVGRALFGLLGTRLPLPWRMRPAGLPSRLPRSVDPTRPPSPEAK